MGIAASRSQAALLKQAESLLGKDDLDTLEKCWDRVSFGHRLDARGFQRALFGSFVMMPNSVSNCIFNAFVNGAGVRADMDWNQFLCGCAVLLRGTDEARATLLFQIYDTKKLGYLTRSRLASFLTTIYDGDPNNGADKGGSIPNELAQLYDAGVPEPCRRSGELEPDEFIARVRFDGKQLVTRWVDSLSEHILEGASPHVLALDRYFSPTLDVAGLARRRRMDPQRVLALERIFFQTLRTANAHTPPTRSSSSSSTPPPSAAPHTSSSGSSMYFTSNQWDAIAGPWIPSALCARVFSALSEMGRPGWTVCDFAEAITSLAHLSGLDGERRPDAGHREGLRLLLNVFDSDRDGKLNLAEAKAMVIALAEHHAHRHSQPSRLHAPPDVERRAPEDPLDLTCLGFPEGATPDEAALQVVGGKSSGCLEGLDELGEWVQGAFGRGALLRDLRLVACAEFGVRPLEPLHEWKVVLELIKRHQATHLTAQRAMQQQQHEQRRRSSRTEGQASSSRSLESKGAPPFKYGPAGTKWNLLPSVWWNHWKSYVQQQQQQLEQGRRSAAGGSASSSSSSSSSSSKTAPGHRARSGSSSSGGGGGTGVRGVPGPIDNKMLLRRPGVSNQLLPNLAPGSDYEVVPPVVWRALSSWYGAVYPLERAVAAIREHALASPQGSSSSNSSSGSAQQKKKGVALGLQLEVYPLCLRATTCDASGKPRPHMEREVVVSKASTVAHLQAKVCSAFLVTTPQEQCRLWNLTSNSSYSSFGSSSALHQAGVRGLGAAAAAISAAGGGGSRGSTGASAGASGGGASEGDDVLSPGDLTMGEANLRDGHLVVLEVALPDGSWPRSQLQADLLDSDDSESEQHSDVGTASTLGGNGGGSGGGGRGAVGNGLVGLHNLGNTCYMNSSLQCLSHTPLLTQFFLNKAAWQNDLNTTNVMGHQGKLASAYAQLVAQLWAPGRQRAFNPAAFKRTVGRLNEQFAGNDQHDAQELLSFLLSGLSEDLNRIAHKPYIEQPDSDGSTSDRELADTWWRNHLKRELSIVVALFTGQFKSLLTCGHCGYASARFEPFTFLQLPLPEETHRSISMLLVPRGTTSPMRFLVRVPKNGSLRDLVQALVDLAGHKKSAGEDNGGEDEDEEDEDEADGDEDNVGSATSARSRDGDEKEDGSACPVIALSARDMALVDVQEHGVASFIALDLPVAKVREHAMLWVYELDPTAVPPPTPPPPPPPQKAEGGEGDAMREERGVSEQMRKGEGEEEADEAEKDATGATSLSDDADAAPERLKGDEVGGDGVNQQVEQTTGGQKTSQLNPLPTNAEAAAAATTAAGAAAAPPPPPPPPSATPLPPPPPAASSALAQQALSFGYNRVGSGSIVVVVMHRCLGRVQGYFMNPFRHYLFGSPLVLRIPADTSCVGLYRIVAERVAFLLKGHAREKLLKDTEDLRGDSNKLGGESGDGGGGGKEGLGLACLAPPVPPTEDPDVRWAETPISGQDAHAGEIPPFGFRLREVTSDGMGDPQSHWLTRSIGRLILFTRGGEDTELGLEDGAFVAIDWHLAVLKGWFDSSSPPYALHPSAAHAKSGRGRGRGGGYAGDRALSLHKCLDTFSASESIQEAYCSKCKEHRNASLKTELWRLPPVLMIHLKRFQFTTYSRRKLHNLVKFPTENLDMCKYVVREEEEEEEEEDGLGGNDEVGEEAKAVAAKGVKAKQHLKVQEKKGADGGETPEGEEPVMGTRDDGRGVEQYDLYAVVHHLGAMSAGHYVSSVRCRETGEWHCFNDNVLIPIKEKEAVSESAYILFYIRKDIAAVENIEDIYAMGEGGGGSRRGSGAEGHLRGGAGSPDHDEDEVARMIKKRDRACVTM